MPKYEYASATVSIATILHTVAKSPHAMSHSSISEAVGIDPTKYDMATRLWNIADKGYLIKEKIGGRNVYKISKEGGDYLKANKDKVQEPGNFNPVKRKAIKKRNAAKKPEPEPIQQELTLSKTSAAAFDGISDLINFNEEMNHALEAIEAILSDVIAAAEDSTPSLDLLGMPLIDARKKKWKGIFADIANVVFDNADTLTFITELHQEIDETLRGKYDYQDADEAATEDEA